ncbi:MAG: nicotinate (nicotinamide) nucleotide adenylyltransferase [Chitinophagales bacterium]
MSKNIGLFFGSFNPIHIGHLIIAETVVDLEKIDQVWFVISPQNPFKKKQSLLNQYDRLHLVNLAVEENHRIKPSTIEFNLPIPSYTIDTLTYLREKYPDTHFYLIMGEDNLKHFHKWKNYEKILEQYQLIVYPRPGYENDLYREHPKVQRLPVPKIEISATHIRTLQKNGKSIRYMVSEKVLEYIDKMNLYS